MGISTRDPESRYLYRVAMVNLMLAGMPVKDLARYSGVSARALASWREKADNEGFSSLRAVKQTGRPKGLSVSQIAEIKDVIANDPEPSGYGSWTGRALSEHIESAYGLKYSARTCQKLLRSFRSGRCFLKEARALSIDCLLVSAKPSGSGRSEGDGNDSSCMGEEAICFSFNHMDLDYIASRVESG